MSGIDDRARLLMRSISIAELNKSGEKRESDRWVNLRRKGSTLRITTEELDRLRELFPRYEDWLWKGDRGIDPVKGQASPDYDEAHQNLDKPAQA